MLTDINAIEITRCDKLIVSIYIKHYYSILAVSINIYSVINANKYFRTNYINIRYIIFDSFKFCSNNESLFDLRTDTFNKVG